ncbi:MAG: hypothetical protein ACOX4S_01060 [Anaerovoracaceae bacterium]
MNDHTKPMVIKPLARCIWEGKQLNRPWGQPQTLSSPEGRWPDQQATRKRIWFIWESRIKINSLRSPLTPAETIFDWM